MSLTVSYVPFGTAHIQLDYLKHTCQSVLLSIQFAIITVLGIIYFAHFNCFCVCRNQTKSSCVIFIVKKSSGEINFISILWPTTCFTPKRFNLLYFQDPSSFLPLSPYLQSNKFYSSHIFTF